MIKVNKHRRYQRWKGTTILDVIKDKDYLWQGTRGSPTNMLVKDKFKVGRNKVSALLRSGRRVTLEDILQTCCNMRTTWSVANEPRGVGKKKSQSHATKPYKDLLVFRSSS